MLTAFPFSHDLSQSPSQGSRLPLHRCDRIPISNAPDRSMPCIILHIYTCAIMCYYICAYIHSLPTQDKQLVPSANNSLLIHKDTCVNTTCRSVIPRISHAILTTPTRLFFSFAWCVIHLPGRQWPCVYHVYCYCYCCI